MLLFYQMRKHLLRCFLIFSEQTQSMLYKEGNSWKSFCWFVQTNQHSNSCLFPTAKHQPTPQSYHSLSFHLIFYCMCAGSTAVGCWEDIKQLSFHRPALMVLVGNSLQRGSISSTDGSTHSDSGSQQFRWATKGSRLLPSLWFVSIS